MNKAIKGATVVLSITILLAMLAGYRNVLALALINHYVLPANIQLNCLEFSPTRHLNIELNQVCLTGENFKLEGENLLWYRNKNTLKAQHVELYIESTPQAADKNTSIPLAIPDSFPLINIKQFDIYSHLLEKPLRLQITQKSRNQLYVSSGWQANITLSPEQWSGQINWTIADLKALGLDIDRARLSTAQKTSPINTEFSFDGRHIVTHSQLALLQQIVMQNCQFDVEGNGEVLIRADIGNQIGSIDLSRFNLSGSFLATDCPLVQTLPDSLVINKATLSFPRSIEVNSQGISVANIILNSRDTQALKMNIDNASYQFNAAATAGFSLLLEPEESIKLVSTGQLIADSTNLSVKTYNQLFISNLTYQQLELTQLKSDFEFNYKTDEGINVEGQASIAQLKRADIQALGITSHFEISGPSLEHLNIVLENNLAKVGNTGNKDFQLSKLANQLDFTLNEFNLLNGTGQSQIGQLNIAGKTINKIRTKHQIQANIKQQHIASEHKIDLEKGFSFVVKTDDSAANIDIANQAVTKLDSLAKLLLPELTLQSGSVSATAISDLATFNTTGQIQFNNISGGYLDFDFAGFNYAPEFLFDSVNLQLADASLTLASLNAGVLLENISASVGGNMSNLLSHDLHANILGGTVNLDNFWLDGREQRAQLNLEDIDMSQLLELEKQSGIELNGHIAGILPLVFSNQQVSIRNGQLYNQHDGTLKINNNSAFNALKSQQPSLANRLSLLEQLNFEKLESIINMSNDGLLKMDIAMVGFNPIAKEKVNFNYTHEENVLVLLKALRLTDSVSKKIEQRIQH